jgi:hypothetical protein
MPGKLERGFSEGDKKRLIARLALLQIKKPQIEPARRFARRSG